MLKRTRVFEKAIRRQVCRHKSTLALKKFDNRSIVVDIDGNDVSFHTVFLRDACGSSRSIDPSSSQKLFTTPLIAKDLRIKEKPRVEAGENGEFLDILWEQGGQLHPSQYTRKFLQRYSSAKTRNQGVYFEYDQVLWDQNTIAKYLDELSVSYRDYVDEKQGGFSKVVDNLTKIGLSFVEEIPNPLSNPKTQEMDEKNVEEWPVSVLANKFGYIKKTFYGTLFDVKNKRDAENIAYTNTFLPLHMDLLYYESPPGLQLLHAIQNSTLGGENIFVDSFAAATHIRHFDPEAYYALTKVPITYHYDNKNEFYHYSRPLFVEKQNPENPSQVWIKEVNYSPPFQGPFESFINNDSASESKIFEDFIRGFTLFEEFINNPNNQILLKLAEGACVVFDNRRVLHSRLAFSDENGGDRWLMGCYVDGDSFRSRQRTNYRRKIH